MITTNDPPAVGLPKRTGNHLTNREQQVLSLLVKGFSNRQIADALGLQTLTVTSHLKHIYKKFGLHNRTAVVAKVLTEGIACGFPRRRLEADLHRLPELACLPNRHKK
jgi:DNA-binding NarL/FixJ family response regulator